MNDFKGQRKNVEYKREFESSPEDVFRQLTPAAEYNWIDGWRCDLVYPDTGRSENNIVFKTDFFGPVGEEYWVCSRYDPSRHLEFVRFSENLIIKVDVTVVENDRGGATGVWALTFTGLNEQGNEMIDHMPPPAENDDFDILITGLDHYLKTGRMLKRPAS